MGSGYRMNLDTEIAKQCNPLSIDDELPQALPSRGTDSNIPDLPEITHLAVAQVVGKYKLPFSQ